MLDLKFLGIGSAFQTHLYNNTAYFQEGDTLFLLDCGETAFEQLKRQSFFRDINKIYVAFTHTHSDHIGGLGQLVEYCNEKLNSKLNIIVPNTESDSLFTDIVDLLNIFSINKAKCNFLLPDNLENTYESFSKINFLPTEHAPELKDKCYSLLFETPTGKVLFTSDTIDTKYIEELVDTNDYSKIYVDSTISLPHVHLDLNILNEIVPDEQKEKIYCMHFDSMSCITEATKSGFNIAPSVAKDLSMEEPTFKYLKLDDKLILNNCGELTFMHLHQKEILNGINEIYLPLESTSNEQVASLGSLLTYCYFVLKKPLYILTDISEVKENMTRLVELYGTPPESISFVKPVEEFFPNEMQNATKTK